MKLLFITFAPLSSNAGHLARLTLTLDHLEKLNEVSILCLGQSPDNRHTISKHKNISFFHLPAKFNGWQVANIQQIVSQVIQLVNAKGTDLVVLQMEVWDLIRELGKNLRNKTRFAAVLHAMPFLIAPLQPSGNFNEDVKEYINSGIPPYRQDYITNHFKEAHDVFKDTLIIANNRTVAHYIKFYFKDVKPLVQAPAIIAKPPSKTITEKTPFYDYTYMARMETGKGIEYMSDILERILAILGRPIRLAVLGRADDAHSKTALDQLLLKYRDDKHIRIDYLGWADDNCKQLALSRTGVFLYPSHYDNYPTVVCEALAFGLPCVTWDALFSQLNFETKAVLRAPMLDTQKFAELAAATLLNRAGLSNAAMRFARSLGTSKTIAQDDITLFRKAIYG